MNIVLVDANTYSVDIDPELALIRADFAKTKNIVKNKLWGEHIMPKNLTYSIGLLRIATILKYNGYNVKYVYFDSLSDYLKNASFDPDLIAFSAVCPTVPRCSRFVDEYRKINSRVKFALGGSQLNAAPKTTMSEFNNFDIYAVGYDIQSAELLVSRKLQPVDESYVDFSLLPYDLSKYSINTCSTLGCPFTCDYCQDRFIPRMEVSSNGFIPYFMERIPERSCVHFFDSVLGGSEKRILEVCEAISATGHKFLLSCDMRAELINERTIAALSKAGFAELRLGLESADDDLLQHNHRFLKQNTVLEKFKMIRELSDIYITVYSAIGFPGTTRYSVEATKDLFSHLLISRKVDEIKNCLFVPYPFDVPRFSEEDITVIDTNWEHYDRQSRPVYNLSEFTSEELFREYIELSRVISRSWMEAFHLDDKDIVNVPKYGEYFLRSYIES